MPEQTEATSAFKVVVCKWMTAEDGSLENYQQIYEFIKGVVQGTEITYPGQPKDESKLERTAIHADRAIRALQETSEVKVKLGSGVYGERLVRVKQAEKYHEWYDGDLLCLEGRIRVTGDLEYASQFLKVYFEERSLSMEDMVWARDDSRRLTAARRRQVSMAESAVEVAINNYLNALCGVRWLTEPIDRLVEDE